MAFLKGTHVVVHTESSERNGVILECVNEYQKLYNIESGATIFKSVKYAQTAADQYGLLRYFTLLLCHTNTPPQEQHSPVAAMLLPYSLNQWASICHISNDSWWRNLATGERINRNDGELLMLMVSELSEAMEAVRKNKMDDKLPHRKGVEVELADCLIRIFDYAGARGLDLDGAVREKMEYNANREDHTLESRRADGGKKW